MLNKAILFLLILFVKCQEKDEIIRIPLNDKDKQCIKTKNGSLNYRFFIFHERGFSHSILLSEYIIENMKNLDLY